MKRGFLHFKWKEPLSPFRNEITCFVFILKKKKGKIRISSEINKFIKINSRLKHQKKMEHSSITYISRPCKIMSAKKLNRNWSSCGNFIWNTTNCYMGVIHNDPRPHCMTCRTARRQFKLEQVTKCSIK